MPSAGVHASGSWQSCLSQQAQCQNSPWLSLVEQINTSLPLPVQGSNQQQEHPLQLPDSSHTVTLLAILLQMQMPQQQPRLP